MFVGQPSANPGNRRWPALGNRLLSGLVHQLNNRAYALLAISTELEEAGDPEVIALLKDEVSRLERAVQLLRLLPSTESVRPEDLATAGLLESVRLLYAQRSGARMPSCTLTVERDIPPMRADEMVAARTLLLACELVADEELALTMGARHVDGRVVIRIRRRASSHPDSGGRRLSEDDLAELIELSEPDGGRIGIMDCGGIELRYPAVHAAR